ncbi:hypothetical protein [Microbacterium sp.]|uniref:hypothetical protein n=1 Tax=Microbacterium sp. TaxID=51671 RepID=UPI003A9311ED
MILWFTLVQIAIAVVAGIFCVTAGLMGRRPSDFTVGALAIVELLLIIQVIVAIVSPFAGNPPSGDLLELWVYLVSAVLVPIGGVVWALVERSRWSTVILGLLAFAVAIMLWRMEVIWTIQVA